MSWNRSSIRLPWFKIRWQLTWSHQDLEIWSVSGNRLWNFQIFWNRFFKPSTWWWFHDNGAVKGVDNCYDFTWNLFIFSFVYTNFELWRYKKGCH